MVGTAILEPIRLTLERIKDSQTSEFQIVIRLINVNWKAKHIPTLL